MVKDIIVIGSGSELAQEFVKLCKSRGISVNTISSNRKSLPDLYVKDYLLDQEKIASFVENFRYPLVVFFNGYLKENRPKYYPTIEEIQKTFFINFKVPYVLTNKILKNKYAVKFIFISSIASVRLRYKNYIYGLSKYLLEKNIKEDKNNLLFIKFGLIHTKMSKDHSKPPFSLDKEKAALLIIENLDNFGVIFPTKELFLVSLFLKILPIKLVDKFEGLAINNKSN